MFEKELAYFIKNQDQLVAKFGGRVLILRGTEVAGVYDSPLAAYLAAQEKFESGTYMIQPCEPGPAAYTVTLASSEVFG